MANEFLGTYDIGFAVGGGNREDLLETIANVTPHDTPFVASAPRVPARHVVHDWLIDSLNATSTAATVEGVDFVTSTFTTRTRLSNLTQIFSRTVKVSNTQRAVDPAGVDDEYKYQIMKAVREINRNVEVSIWHASGVCAIGSTGVARVMKRMDDFLKNGSSTGLKGKVARHIFAWGAGTSGHASTASATIMTEDRFNGMLQYLFNIGGNPDVIYANAHGKRMIADFTAGSIARRTEPLGSKRLTQVVDIFESEFGLLEITLNRWVNRAVGNTAAAHNVDIGGMIYALERAMTRLAILRPIAHVPLPPVGDSARGMVLGELTLEVLNPDSCGRAWGVTNLNFGP